VIAGRRRGPLAAAGRGLLRAAEVPYGWAVRRRNARYDGGMALIHWIGTPVVSVGNLTLGGSGKTPLVAWLAEWFCSQKVRPAIVSRGYGAPRGGPNDEARELAARLPDVPHVQNADRVAAARLALEQHRPGVILLDDGFQHRRLGRDLDIVLLDALEPFGLDHLFPRGTLREPVSGLRRSHVVALSRADVLPAGQRDAIRHRVEKCAPGVVWVELRHAPQKLVSSAGGVQSLDALQGQPVAAFCGLGNPAGFRHTLTACGFDVRAFRMFPDHHAYRRRDVQSLAAWAREQDAAAVLCTHKDLVKIGVERLGALPLWAVSIAIEFLSGREALEAKLANLLPR
jgi:tetraacyldisaccharide 4'-kinase